MNCIALVSTITDIMASVYVYRSHFSVAMTVTSTYLVSPASLYKPFHGPNVPSIRIYVTWFEMATLISNILMPFAVAFLVYMLAKYAEKVRDVQQHKREKQLREVAFLKEMITDILKNLEFLQDDNLYEIEGRSWFGIFSQSCNKSMAKLLPNTDVKLRRLDAFILYMKNNYAEKYEFQDKIEIIIMEHGKFDDALQDYTKSGQRADSLFAIERALLEIRIKLSSFHV